MANSPFINSVYINLKYHTALQSASGILQSENVVSMFIPISQLSLFISKLQHFCNWDWIYFWLTEERSSEDK